MQLILLILFALCQLNGAVIRFDQDHTSVTITEDESIHIFSGARLTNNTPVQNETMNLYAFSKYGNIYVSDEAFLSFAENITLCQDNGGAYIGARGSRIELNILLPSILYMPNSQKVMESHDNSSINPFTGVDIVYLSIAVEDDDILHHNCAALAQIYLKGITHEKRVYIKPVAYFPKFIAPKAIFIANECKSHIDVKLIFQGDILPQKAIEISIRLNFSNGKIRFDTASAAKLGVGVSLNHYAEGIVETTVVEIRGTVAILNSFFSTIEFCISSFDEKEQTIDFEVVNMDGFSLSNKQISVAIPVYESVLSSPGSIDIDFTEDNFINVKPNAISPVGITYRPGSTNTVAAQITLSQGSEDLNLPEAGIIGIESVQGIQFTHGFKEMLVQRITINNYEEITGDIYSKLVHFRTDFQREVQIIDIRLDKGEEYTEIVIKLTFNFTGVKSSIIIDLHPSIASPAYLEQALNSLSNLGIVRVSRDDRKWENGFSWSITFETLASPNIPLLTSEIVSFPGTWSGSDPAVIISRKREGNMRPQVERVVVSYDKPLTSGEFSLGIKLPGSSLVEIPRLGFNISAETLKHEIESKTKLDQVLVSTSINTGQIMWDITFITDTYIDINSKIQITTTWKGDSKNAWSMQCELCSPFSSTFSGGEQVQTLPISRGSIGLHGYVTALLPSRPQTYVVNIRATQVEINNLMAESDVTVSIVDCEDPNVKCTWNFAISFHHPKVVWLNLNTEKLLGSGVQVEETEGRCSKNNMIWLIADAGYIEFSRRNKNFTIKTINVPDGQRELSLSPSILESDLALAAKFLLDENEVIVYCRSLSQSKKKECEVSFPISDTAFPKQIVLQRPLVDNTIEISEPELNPASSRSKGDMKEANIDIIISSENPVAHWRGSLYKITCRATSGRFAIKYGNWMTSFLDARASEAELTSKLSELKRGMEVVVFSTNHKSFCESKTPVETFLKIRIPFVQRLIIYPRYLSEVQAIETFADDLETIDRAEVFISLRLGNNVNKISVNLSSKEGYASRIQEALSGLPYIGQLSVSRSPGKPNGSHRWLITFNSLSGLVPLMKVDIVDFPAKWSGLGEKVKVSRVQVGTRPNSICTIRLHSDYPLMFGTFRLLDSEKRSEPLSFHATAAEVQSAIEELGYKGYITVNRIENAQATPNNQTYQVKWIVTFTNFGTEIPHLIPKWRSGLLDTNCFDCDLPSFPFISSSLGGKQIVNEMTLNSMNSGDFQLQIVLDVPNSSMSTMTSSIKTNASLDVIRHVLNQSFANLNDFVKVVNVEEITSQYHDRRVLEIAYQLSEDVIKPPVFKFLSRSNEGTIEPSEFAQQISPTIEVITQNLQNELEVGMIKAIRFANIASLDLESNRTLTHMRSFKLSRTYCPNSFTCNSEVTNSLNWLSTPDDIRKSLEKILGFGLPNLHVSKKESDAEVKWYIRSAPRILVRHLSLFEGDYFKLWRGGRSIRFRGSPVNVSRAFNSTRFFSTNLNHVENLNVQISEMICGITDCVNVQDHNKSSLIHVRDSYASYDAPLFSSTTIMKYQGKTSLSNIILENVKFLHFPLNTPVILRIECNHGEITCNPGVGVTSISNSKLVELQGSLGHVIEVLSDISYRIEASSQILKSRIMRYYQLMTIIDDTKKSYALLARTKAGTARGSAKIGIYISNSSSSNHIVNLKCTSASIFDTDTATTIQQKVLDMLCVVPPNEVSLYQHEIQVITIDVPYPWEAPDLIGTYEVTMGQKQTRPIPFSATGNDLRLLLLEIYNDNGLRVSRVDEFGTISWKITFGSFGRQDPIKIGITQVNLPVEIKLSVLKSGLEKNDLLLKNIYPSLEIITSKISAPENSGFSWNLMFSGLDDVDFKLFVYSNDMKDEITNAIANVSVQEISSTRFEMTGTFKLRFGPHTTDPIQYSASVDELNTAFSKLPLSLNSVKQLKSPIFEHGFDWLLEVEHLRNDHLLTIDDVQLSCGKLQVSAQDISSLTLLAGVDNITSRLFLSESIGRHRTLISLDYVTIDLDKAEPQIELYIPDAITHVAVSHSNRGSKVLEGIKIICDGDCFSPSNRVNLSISCALGEITPLSKWEKVLSNQNNSRTLLTITGSILQLNSVLADGFLYSPSNSTSGSDNLKIKVEFRGSISSYTVQVKVTEKTLTIQSPIETLFGFDDEDLPILGVKVHSTFQNNVSHRVTFDCRISAVGSLFFQAEGHDFVGYERSTEVTSTHDAIQVEGSLEGINAALERLVYIPRKIESIQSTQNLLIKVWSNDSFLEASRVLNVTIRKRFVAPSVTWAGREMDLPPVVKSFRGTVLSLELLEVDWKNKTATFFDSMWNVSIRAVYGKLRGPAINTMENSYIHFLVDRRNSTQYSNFSDIGYIATSNSITLDDIEIILSRLVDPHTAIPIRLAFHILVEPIEIKYDLRWTSNNLSHISSVVEASSIRHLPPISILPVNHDGNEVYSASVTVSSDFGILMTENNKDAIFEFKGTVQQCEAFLSSISYLAPSGSAANSASVNISFHFRIEDFKYEATASISMKILVNNELLELETRSPERLLTSSRSLLLKELLSLKSNRESFDGTLHISVLFGSLSSSKDHFVLFSSKSYSGSINSVLSDLSHLIYHPPDNFLGFDTIEVSMSKLKKIIRIEVLEPSNKDIFNFITAQKNNIAESESKLLPSIQGHTDSPVQISLSIDSGFFYLNYPVWSKYDVSIWSNSTTLHITGSKFSINRVLEEIEFATEINLHSDEASTSVVVCMIDAGFRELCQQSMLPLKKRQFGQIFHQLTFMDSITGEEIEISEHAFLNVFDEDGGSNLILTINFPGARIESESLPCTSFIRKNESAVVMQGNSLCLSALWSTLIYDFSSGIKSTMTASIEKMSKLKREKLDLFRLTVAPIFILDNFILRNQTIVSVDDIVEVLDNVSDQSELWRMELYFAETELCLPSNLDFSYQQLLRDASSMHLHGSIIDLSKLLQNIISISASEKFDLLISRLPLSNDTKLFQTQKIEVKSARPVVPNENSLQVHLQEKQLIITGYHTTVNLSTISIIGSALSDTSISVEIRCTNGMGIKGLSEKGEILHECSWQNWFSFTSNFSNINEAFQQISVALSSPSFIYGHIEIKLRQNNSITWQSKEIEIFSIENYPGQEFSFVNAAINVTMGIPQKLDVVFLPEIDYGVVSGLWKVSFRTAYGRFILMPTAAHVAFFSSPEMNEIIAVGSMSEIVGFFNLLEYLIEPTVESKDEIIVSVVHLDEGIQNPRTYHVKVQIEHTNTPPKIIHEFIESDGVHSVTKIEIMDSDMILLRDAVKHSLFLLTIKSEAGVFSLGPLLQNATVLSLGKEPEGLREIAVQAPLFVLNRMLDRVMYSRKTLHADLTDELELTVSDQSHGSYFPVEATTSVVINLRSSRRKLHPNLSGAYNGTTFVEATRALETRGISVTSSQSSLARDHNVTVMASCEWKTTLEIQKISLAAPPNTFSLEISISGSETIHGWFEIELEIVFMTSPRIIHVKISADSVPMIKDEVFGLQGTGYGSGESVEARILSALGLSNRKLGIFVTKRLKSDVLEGNSWDIFVAEPDLELRGARLKSSHLTSSQNIDVILNLQSLESTISGTFNLKIGDEVTRNISASASEMEVQDALEALASIQAVKVSRTFSSKNRGMVWEITFLSPSSNIPMLFVSTNGLRPLAKISDSASNMQFSRSLDAFTERISVGSGQPTVYQIDFGALHVDQVYSIQTHGNSSLSGEFTLGFQDISSQQVLAQTGPIAYDAVCSRQEEGVSSKLGGRVGESVEHKLGKAIEIFRSRYQWFHNISIVCSRSKPDVFGGFTWTIALRNVSASFPQLICVESNNLRGTHAKIEIKAIQVPNSLGGSFRLSFRGAETAEILFNADAEEVKSKLEDLSSVRDVERDFGSVVVRRSISNLENAASYCVVIVEELSQKDLFRQSQELQINTKSLSGLGAFGRVSQLYKRPSGGYFLVPAHSTWFSWSTPHSSNSSPGEFFRWKGYLDEIENDFQVISYHFPPGCSGTARILFELFNEAGIRLSYDVSNYFKIMEDIFHVEWHIDLVDSFVWTVVGEHANFIDFIHIVTPSPMQYQEISLRISVGTGKLYLDAEHEMEIMLLRGTSQILEDRLKMIRYRASRNSTIDHLNLFLELDGMLLSTQEILIEIDWAVVSPRIQILGSIEAPFDSKYWEVPQIRTQTNTRLKLSGVSITGISDDESITLHLEPYVGTVSFRDPDGLSRNNGSFSSYIGKVGDFNRALNHLYYSPLEQYIGDDILIIRLSIQNKSPLQHERKIMLSIYPQSEMQDIVLSSSVYHVAEDTGFQFPKLNLGFFSSKAIRPLQSNVRRYSLVASQFAQPDWKFNNSSNQTNNWRHRQVANFDFIPPENFCILGNNMYFTASDEIHGTELWVSDGSMAGTKVFLDLMPGRKGSNPSFLTPLNGNMIFSASAIDLSWKLDDPLCGGLRQSSIFSNVYYVVSQSNIWNPQRNYDCPAGFRWLTTKEGISLFTNERAESKSSDGSYVFWNKCGWKGYDFGGYTRKYFRFADSHSSGSMKHAGSDERAPMDTNFAISDFAGIVCIKSKVDDGNTRALWLTDGSIDGTRRIHENRGSIVGSNPKYLTKFGEKELLFQAETDAYGVELYKTDGTASGTALVEDIWKGPRSSNPMFFAVWSADNRVYFAATTDYGTELWVSDGYSSFTQERSSKTSSANVGTYMVKDICVGTKSSDPRFIVGGSSKLFFSADDCLNGRELWISDGTTVGTHMVTDLNPLPGIGSDPTSLTIFSGKVYFQAEADKSTGRELYMSDGTAQGTLLLVDLSPGPSSSFPSQLTVLPFFSKRGMLVGHYMYFTANKSGKINLWRLDSSFVSQPIQILSDSFTSNWILNESQSPKQNLPFFFYNQELYFTAQSSSYTNSVQESVVEDYRLQVKVSRGNIITSNRYDTVNPLSKGLWITSSPLDDLQPTLESLVYVPPQNWNSESQEGDHILSWSLNFTRGEKSSFKSGYLWVSPRNDPPVINVPTAVYNYNQRTGDYNSLLRMICSPIYVNEDSSFLLSEFSVEAIDSMRFEGEDKFYSMRIAISANIGRIEASSLDCVDMIESCTIDSVCFDATPLCINTIFQNIMYIPKPNFSGNDYLTIMVSAPSGLSDKAVVPLWIQEVNDAPYVVGQRQFYVGEDVPSIVSELLIIDPDNKTEEIIVVSLRVDKGSIFILNNSSIAYNSEPSGTTISFQGTIDNINIAVSKIVFTSYKDWNSISGDLGTVYATIFVSLTDSEKFNSTSTSVIHIMVEPTSDPAIISLPKNLKTDVMISSANHVLHCKEDSWLAIEGFNFSSSDANIDLSITVEIRVGHGALHLMTESGITFEKGTSNFKSNIVITGTLFYVNEAITALKYKPNLDYFGTDTMDISGFSIDEYTKQVSISADKQIMIIIHPVNDAPIWLTPNVLTLNVTGNDLFPTLIRGVRFTDVDCTGSNACEMELSIESTHGFIHLPNAKGSNFFITDYPARNNFIALSGNYEDLNRIIDEVIFVLDEVNYYSITDGERNQIGITFSIDDKANTGIGGSFVVSTTLSLSPLFWSKSYLSLKVPSSVLVLVEDEVLLFGDKIEVINQHADRSLRSLVGVTVHVSHGMFFLSSDDGIDILRNASEEIIFQGAIAKVNAALQDSYYIPSADWFGTDVIRIEVYNERDLNDSRSIYIEVEPACNEVTLDIQQSEFVTDEDTEIIIAGIKLKHREARFEEQSIEISISVSNGGVKLLLWENLIVLDAEQMIDQIDNKMGSSETVISHSQKYFSKMTLLGNPKQLEASMSSMSYIPKRNFNTFGRCPDEILLTSKSSCSLLKPFIGGIQIVVLPVNDPPQLIAPFVFPMLFPKIPSRDPNNGHNYLFSSNAIEIMNSSSVLLKSIRLIDPDLDDEDDDLSLQVTIDSHHGQVSVNCSNEHIQAVFVPNINKSGITMKGNLKSLNSMLQCLTFKNTKKYKGDAFIAITVSDLGNTGKGNEHHESYVIPLKIGDMKGNFSLDTSYCSEEVEVPLISVEERKSIGLRCPGYDDPNKYINTKLESNQWTLAVIRPLTYQDVDDSMAHNSKLRIETIKTFPGASSYSDVSFLVQLKGKLLFRAKDELGGEELWESDGTSNGTLILKDLFPGPRGSNPGYITKYVSKDIVLFAADGLDLSWRIKSSWRDKCNGFRQSRHNENAFYVVSALNIWDKEKIYDCPANFRWMSTSEARKIFNNSASFTNERESYTYFDQCGWKGYQWGDYKRMYFRFSDSKITGAYKHAGYKDSYRIDIGFDTDYFAGIVCIRDESNLHTGTELWATDGTKDGTKRVLDIYPGPVGSNPAHFVEHNDLLYFQASFPDYGAELWATDASKEGTFMVADIEPGIEGSFPELLTVFNTMIVFSASNHLHGREIWFSDGKARNDYSRSLIGTGLLADICSGTGSSNPAYFTMLNSKSLMLFQADDCVYGPELWRTDGTSSGTFMLVDINPGSEGSSPSSLTQFNNLVFFHADDGIHGPELWISDGSVKGTRILKDLSPGVEGSRPRFFTIFPSLQRVVFIATSRMDQTSELWQTDGTVIGTERIFMYSIEPLWLNERSMQMMNPSRLVNFEENLYFFGKSTSIQFEAGVGIVQDAAFVSVSCSKGLLELTGYHANIRVLRGSNSSSIDIVTPFYLINFILEKMIYRPQKDMLGRDEVYITIKLDDSNGISSSYTYLIMYVDIIHHNQPPVINMLPEYSVSIDDIVRVKNIALEDVDAGDGMLYLEITVNYGEVWIDYFDSRGRSAPTGAIKLYLTLADAKIALEQLMYRCPSESGCKAGMRDYLTIEVDDNGHDGAGGGKMSYMRSSISIYDEKIS